MIWVAWRRQRLQVLVISGVVLLYGGAALAERLQPGLTGMTRQLAGYFVGLVAMFWGVPLLARELESGVYRMSWTQGLTRGRWLAYMLGVAAAGTVVLTGVLAAILAWAVSGEAPGRPRDALDLLQSDSVGPALFARVLFGLCLGAMLGALIRRAQLAVPLAMLGTGLAQLGLRQVGPALELLLCLLGAAGCIALTWLAIRRRS
ncbi:hypothetical protein [Nonomuraea endophytica]|uniref:hypothetical protein n=1 Tax=Nonomuraea endophytica TaxID=714136 RepID=UPI0037C8C36E